MLIECINFLKRVGGREGYDGAGDLRVRRNLQKPAVDRFSAIGWRAGVGDGIVAGAGLAAITASNIGFFIRCTFLTKTETVLATGRAS